MYTILGPDNQTKRGPGDLEQVRQWIAAGLATAQPLVYQEGATDRVPLEPIPELRIPVTSEPSRFGRWVFAGDFEPDSVTKVAEPILVADNPGMASLALELRGPEVHAVNLYQIKVC